MAACGIGTHLIKIKKLVQIKKNYQSNQHEVVQHFHIQEELHKPGANTSFNHSLDLIISAIR
jgi:hypothetical protein